MSDFFDVYVTEQGGGGDARGNGGGGNDDDDNDDGDADLGSILSWNAEDEEDADGDDDDRDVNDNDNTDGVNGNNAGASMGGAGGTGNGGGGSASASCSSSFGLLDRGRSSLTATSGLSSVSDGASSVATGGGGMGPASVALQRLTAAAAGSAAGGAAAAAAAGGGGLTAAAAARLARSGTGANAPTSPAAAPGVPMTMPRAGSLGVGLGGLFEDDSSLNGFLAQLQSEYSDALVVPQGGGAGAQQQHHQHRLGSMESMGTIGTGSGDGLSVSLGGLSRSGANSMSNLLMDASSQMQFQIPTLPLMMPPMPQVEEPAQPKQQDQQQQDQQQTADTSKGGRRKGQKRKTTTGGNGGEAARKVAKTQKRQPKARQQQQQQKKSPQQQPQQQQEQPASPQQQHPLLPLAPTPDPATAPSPKVTSETTNEAKESEASSSQMPMAPLALPPAALPNFAAAGAAAAAPQPFGGAGGAVSITPQQFQQQAAMVAAAATAAQMGNQLGTDGVNANVNANANAQLLLRQMQMQQLMLSSMPPTPTPPMMALSSPTVMPVAAVQQQQQQQQGPPLSEQSSPLASSSTAPSAFIAPNVISCSDTDGLMTDVESTRVVTAEEGGSKTSGGGHQQQQQQQAAASAPPAAGGRGRGRGRGNTASTGRAGTKRRAKASPAAATAVNSAGGLGGTIDFIPSILPKAPVDEAEAAMNEEEDRLRVARERNREHARNTRIRKKAYVDKLKVTVEELCHERDVLVSERAGAANLLVEMHNTRTDVLMSFFALRSANERRRELWSSILDESRFACLLPVTPYRSFPASEVQAARCQRTVLGIDGIMADTSSLHVLLNSLVDRTRFPSARIKFKYTVVTEDAVVAGNQVMARWIMSTSNAMECGANMEVSKRGMLCCKFNSSHKITGLELMFDVMAFMLQLKQAAGTDSFAVVPNTVQTCQKSFDLPMVMTLAERPYTIVQVNRQWEDMTGWKSAEVVGRACCRILQGKGTERSTLDELMSDVCHKRPAYVALTNYTKSGRQFQNHLNMYPLSTDSKVTHYIALTTHILWADGKGPESDRQDNIAELASAKLNEMIAKDGEVIKVTSADATGVSSSTSDSQNEPKFQCSSNTEPEQVSAAEATDRQDSSATHAGSDTVSSLTSSLSSSNSDGGSSKGRSTSSAPKAKPKNNTTASRKRPSRSGARKTVTIQPPSASSSAGD